MVILAALAVAVLHGEIVLELPQLEAVAQELLEKVMLAAIHLQYLAIVMVMVEAVAAQVAQVAQVPLKM